jgi:hypothetical protein
MSTTTQSRYVPTFGAPDDLKLVDLSTPEPLDDDAEMIAEWASALNARSEAITARLIDIDEHPPLIHELDARERERLRLSIQQGWYTNLIDTIYCWTGLWWEDGGPVVLHELTERDMAGLNRALGRTDTFPIPPYGATLLETDR